jgi:VCBS repeat protein
MNLRFASLAATGLCLFCALPAAAQMFGPPFSLPAYVPPPGSSGPLDPAGAVTGDFDGDGNVDLALVNFYYLGPALVMYLGDIGGTLHATTEYSDLGIERAHGIVAGDFDGDGKVDMAVTSRSDANGAEVRVLKGDGNAGFTWSLGMTLGNVDNVLHLLARDVNGDNKLDLVVAVFDGTFSTTVQFKVLLGFGTGIFSVPEEYDSDQFTGTSGDSWTMLDVNNDGRLDIVVVAGYYLGYTGDGIVALTGNADGSFDGPYQLRSGTQLEADLPSQDLYFHAATAADIDGDGHLDFVFADGFAVYWCRLIPSAPGTTAISAAQLIGTYPGAAPTYIRTNDFDKNGRNDVAVAGKLFLHQPNGTWLGQDVSYPGADMLAARDLDKDGLIDLVTTGHDANHIASVHNVDPLLVDGFEGGNLTVWLGGKKP